MHVKLPICDHDTESALDLDQPGFLLILEGCKTILTMLSLLLLTTVVTGEVDHNNSAWNLLHVRCGQQDSVRRQDLTQVVRLCHFLWIIAFIVSLVYLVTRDAPTKPLSQCLPSLGPQTNVL